MNKILCPISGQSEKEEQLNTVTHFFGLIMSILGFSYLLYLSFKSKNPLAPISSTFYGITLLLLYGASTLYHYSASSKQKQRLKVIDHACIYLLIAGSYTPFTLGPLKDSGGFLIMGIEWTIAAIGIALKIFSIDRFQLISILAYLGMGWLIVFSFETLMQEISPAALYFLVAAGFSYSFGVIFYLVEKIPYNHAIWHLFVLLGSLFHYLSVLELINS